MLEFIYSKEEIGGYDLFDSKDRIGVYNIFNSKEEFLGKIKKRRVGRFMHWCFEPEDSYFTNGCLKEITTFITKLYSKKIKGGKK